MGDIHTVRGVWACRPSRLAVVPYKHLLAVADTYINFHDVRIKFACSLKVVPRCGMHYALQPSNARDSGQVDPQWSVVTMEIGESIIGNHHRPFNSKDTISMKIQQKSKTEKQSNTLVSNSIDRRHFHKVFCKTATAAWNPEDYHKNKMELCAVSSYGGNKHYTKVHTDGDYLG